MASSSKLFLLLVVFGVLVCTSSTARKLTSLEPSFADEKTLDGGGLSGSGDLEFSGGFGLGGGGSGGFGVGGGGGLGIGPIMGGGSGGVETP
ncbi:hypothetical protein R6Q59_009645 [Mikania micrantha]